MKIMGIDPGTGILGFGVIEAGIKPRLIDAGVIRTPPHQELSTRLLTIYEELEQIIIENKPQVIVVEQIFFAKNVTTAISVSHARGVVLLLGKKHGLELVEKTPLQIKQITTGYGNASKSQVQEMVRIQLGLKEIPKPDDCADALAAALTYNK